MLYPMIHDLSIKSGHLYGIVAYCRIANAGLRCQAGPATASERRLPEALMGRLALAIISSTTTGLLLQSKSRPYSARHMEPKQG